jgi:hypothetical protein
MAEMKGTPVPEVTEKRAVTNIVWVRIVWEQHEFVRIGKVNGIRLFSIMWHNRKSDPNWIMRCDLPGYDASTQRWCDDDRSFLESKAADMLVFWLRRIRGEQ